MDGTVRGSFSPISWLALAVFLVILFAVLLDNGTLLSPFLSNHAPNYLHELFHDGRHVLGVPCH